MTSARAALLWALLAGSACADIAGFDGTPQMDPGRDCLTCHRAGGAASGLTFTVGGTVYQSATGTDAGPVDGAFDVDVHLTDATGRQIVLHSNGAGNFYSAETLVPPFQASVVRGKTSFAMLQPAPSGACNACHALVENADGTFQTAPIPSQFPGYTRPPGHLFAFAEDGGCGVASGTCPNPAPSYANQVQSIVEGNCLPCHAAGGSAAYLPLDTVAAIQKTGVGTCESFIENCTMPLAASGPMSPEQFSTLIAWLSCGAPAN